MPFSYRIIVLGRGVNQHFALTNAPKLGKLFLLCGYGGIGRRAGFRVQCPRRAGSSPVSRTISKRAYLRIINVDALFFMFFNVLTCSNTLFSRRKSVVKNGPVATHNRAQIISFYHLQIFPVPRLLYQAGVPVYVYILAVLS